MADAGNDAASPEFSEDAIALHFAGEHAADLRYVAAWSKWMIWDGNRWSDDQTLAGFDEIRTACRAAAAAYVFETRSTSGPKAMAGARTAKNVDTLARP